MHYGVVIGIDELKPVFRLRSIVMVGREMAHGFRITICITEVGTIGMEHYEGPFSAVLLYLLA